MPSEYSPRVGFWVAIGVASVVWMIGIAIVACLP